MERMFASHRVRRCRELSGSLWQFQILEGGTPCSAFQEKREREWTKENREHRVFVPSCWEKDPLVGRFRGKAAYRRTFRAGGNLRLVFCGVGHTADVLVDGRACAHHYNAYTAFDAVLRDVPEGTHTLEVDADNRFSEASALHVPNDYMSYGGITRPVILEELGSAWIRELHFTPSYSDGVWHASVEARVQNLSDAPFAGKLVLSLAGRTEERPVRLPAGGEQKVVLEDMAFDRVTPWSPEEPKLYEITALLAGDGGKPVDDQIDRVGFRTVETGGGRILLNGRPLRIKGFCRHEEHPMFGSAIPPEAMQMDLSFVKDLGANFIRCTHYPNDERFLDLCDEEGILVWEENHARGLALEQMQNPNFEPQAEQVIREMISQHYNHPSIVIWGILNECASDSEYGASCYRKQYDLIRSLDASRPSSSASCKFRTDLCFGYPDIVSYNVYPFWYHDAPPEHYVEDLYQWVQEETGGKGKPFLITEVGAGAMYGYRSSDGPRWSEEYQAFALEQQLKGILGNPHTSGCCIWQFADGNVSEEWWDKRPGTMNNKGVLDPYRRPKRSYETVKQIYHSCGNYFE